MICLNVRSKNLIKSWVIKKATSGLRRLWLGYVRLSALEPRSRSDDIWGVFSWLGNYVLNDQIGRIVVVGLVRRDDYWGKSGGLSCYGHLDPDFRQRLLV